MQEALPPPTPAAPVQIEAAAAIPETTALPRSEPVAVLLVGAAGLVSSCEKTGFFCALALKGHPGSEKKTKAVQSTEPLWWHELELSDRKAGEDIEIKVFKVESGQLTPEVAGRTTLPSSAFASSGCASEVALEGAGPQAIVKLKVKVLGQSYPHGWAHEFKIVLQNDGDKLGLLLDIADKKNALISGLDEQGWASKYNVSAPLEMQISPGQYLVQADKGSNARAIAQVVKAPVKALTIRRAAMFPANLTKQDGSLRIVFAHMIVGSSTSLVIHSISTGPVTVWNQTNPALEIMVGDRIFAVNGERGTNVALLEKIKAQPQEVQLTIHRPACDRIGDVAFIS